MQDAFVQTFLNKIHPRKDRPKKITRERFKTSEEIPVQIEYPTGYFCWVDLATSDPDAAKNFYHHLFGWEYFDAPAGEGMVYSMCNLEGTHACALYEMDQSLQTQNIPSHWSNYVSVDDLDATLEQASSLGADVVMSAINVMTAGRMAVIQDPTGSYLNLWQPQDHQGAQVVNAHNAWVWSELATRDTASAEKFYTELFGWQAETDDNPPMRYTTFSKDGRLLGGMFEIQPQWGEVPPNWGTYFAVANCDRAVELIQAHGGQILNPATDLPGIGRFAVAMDPTGAAFSVIAPQAMDPPPGL